MRYRSRSSAGGRRRRGGFATLLVFGVLVFAALALAMVQASAFGQAGSGREAVARVRAEWAARAGVEAALARLEAEVDRGDDGDAFARLEAMSQVADGELDGATWRVRSLQDGREVAGPEDAAAKININRMTKEQLLAVEPFMTEDVADSVLDWIDADDDTRELGAEIGYYKGLAYPVEPRNDVMRSIAELELVAGVDAKDVRGEDWNLNGILDPNEDDGNASWPPDNQDGILDRGWSGIMTAYSAESPLALSGQKRLDLTVASVNEIVTRLQVTQPQAQAVRDSVDNVPGIRQTDFVRFPLGNLNRQAARNQGKSQQEQRNAARVQALTTEQLGKVLDECSMGPAELATFVPGRLNVNTCDAKTMEYLAEIDPSLADAIIAERSGRSNGFTSVADLLDVDGMSRQTLADIAELLTTRSSVYVVHSKGRDERTGLEVEVSAVLDASTLPAVKKEVRVR
ncbi:MAG: type II secretion system protein GspK [Phycisphaerales bacterium]